MISDDIPDHVPFIDSKFLDRLACYSFFSWVKHGIGCVIVQEPQDGVAPDDIVEDLIDYTRGVTVAENGCLCHPWRGPSKLQQGGRGHQVVRRRDLDVR